MSAEDYSDLGLADIEPIEYDGASFEAMLATATDPNTPPVEGLDVPEAVPESDDDIDEIQLVDDDLELEDPVDTDDVAPDDDLINVDDDLEDSAAPDDFGDDEFDNFLDDDSDVDLGFDDSSDFGL